MNFLFWNLKREGKKLKNEVAELCKIHNIDVLMLAEWSCEERPCEPVEILRELNKQNRDKYYFAQGFAQGTICEKILIFSKFEEKLIAPIEENKRITARKLISSKYDIILVVIHFQSKVNWSLEDQTAHVPNIKRILDSVESKLGHKRTVICGDFNMNPFDFGVVQSTGLNAVMEKQIAKKQKRRVDGEDYTFFYNPMWGFLGDLGRGVVSGTHYFAPSKPISYHWHLFDQVLIRPDLLSDFDDAALDIITTIGKKNLLTKSNQINSRYSDHLPIKFSLKI